MAPPKAKSLKRRGRARRVSRDGQEESPVESEDVSATDSMKPGRAGAKRRQPGQTLTEAALLKELEYLSRMMRGVERHVMPSDDSSEKQRRDLILLKGLNRALLACALVVKERHRELYGAITAAARRWASAELEGRRGDFAVTRIDGRAAVEAFFGGPLFVAAYDHLVERLTVAWKQQAPATFVKTPRIASGSTKYGESQYQAGKRISALHVARAEYLRDAILETFAHYPDLPELREKVLRRIARTSRGPAGAAMASLALVFNQSPRTMKAKVSAGRKHLERAARVREALAARGFQPAAGASTARQSRA